MLARVTEEERDALAADMLAITENIALQRGIARCLGCGRLVPADIACGYCVFAARSRQVHVGDAPSNRALVGGAVGALAFVVLAYQLPPPWPERTAVAGLSVVDVVIVPRWLAVRRTDRGVAGGDGEPS